MNKLIWGWILFTGLIFSQTGNIKGKIIDTKTKQPLIGANVLIIGTTMGAATDSEGVFLIKNVKEDVYKLKINYIGYHSHIEPDIRVIRGKTFYVKEVELTEAYINSDEVTVMSGYFNEAIDMPVSNYSYSKDEIIRAPGAGGDIFRAVESLPGVSSSGGEFSSFSVRGGTPKDNLILIDNIPFSNISHFSEASGSEEVEGGRFSIFTTGLIEKANFQAGGFGSRYGGKKASFLDLTLKEGNQESYSINGSYDLFGWEVNYDGPTYLLNNTSMVVSARSLDFKTAFDLMDMLDEGHVAFEDYIIKFTSNIHRNHKLSLLGIYSSEKSVRDISHLLKAENFEDRKLRNEPEKKHLTGFNWRFLSSKNSYLNTSVYYSKLDQSQQEGKAYVGDARGIKPKDTQVSYTFPLFRYKADEEQLGVKSDFTYNYSDMLTFNAGVNFQTIKRKTDIKMFAPDTVYEFNENELPSSGEKYLIVSPDEINNNFCKTRNEFSAYAETNIKPAKKLNLNVGFRIEYDDLSEQTDVSPRFSGSYQINPITSINFAAGIYNQISDMQTLSSNSRNVKLKKEKSYHFILGATRYFRDDLKLTVEGYYKNLKDLIVRPNSTNTMVANTGKGYSYGIDVSLMKRFVNKMYGQINYSYSVSKLKEHKNATYMNSDFNQPHIFNLLVGYQFNDNWSISAKWKFASGRPRNSYMIYENVLNNSEKLRYAKVITAENVNRYDSFHSLNIRVDYRRQFSKYLALIAYIDIHNVYDRENGYRDNFIEVTGKNEVQGLSMMPTIGFKLEM